MQDYEIMSITGKIMPALITSTASISGSIMLEFLKYMSQKCVINSDPSKIKILRNYKLNMNDN